MTTTTFERVLDAARQLSRQDRARLIATVAEELAAPITPAEQQTIDPWQRLDQLREELHTLYPEARFGERLDADRNERTSVLGSDAGLDNVHS